MLLGGVTWIGLARARPCDPDRLRRQAARGPGRLARLEMAVHLPRSAGRQRQPTGGAGRRAAALLAHLGQRDERVLHPPARQHDLHDERHDLDAEPDRRHARAYSGASRPTTAATASPTCTSRCMPCRPTSSPPGSPTTRGNGPALDAASYQALESQSTDGRALHLRRRRPGAVRRRSSRRTSRPRPGPDAGTPSVDVSNRDGALECSASSPGRRSRSTSRSR